MCSPLGNRHAPTNGAYHVAGSEQAYAGMACQRNLRGRKHEPYFLDVPDIYVGEKGRRPMPYIPVGAIVGAIHMQNTISRHRREEEEEAKKKRGRAKKQVGCDAYVFQGKAGCH